MRNTILIVVLVAVLAGVGGFYAGKQSQPDQQSLSAEQRVRIPQAGARMRNGQAGGLTVGEIITKDKESVTVKLRDGGSKIILLSAGTEIGKIAVATADDLGVGTMITASGVTNPDGSLTATSIQVRTEKIKQ
ncbi:MAG: hypothetical protein V1707_02590 [bacterium]